MRFFLGPFVTLLVRTAALSRVPVAIVPFGFSTDRLKHIRRGFVSPVELILGCMDPSRPPLVPFPLDLVLAGCAASGQSSAERAEPPSSHSVGRKRLRLVGLAALPIGMASLPAAKPIGADDVGICSAGFLFADVESPNSCSSSSIKWLCLNGPCLERYAQCAPCKAHEALPRPRSTANTAHHTPAIKKRFPAVKNDSGRK